MELIAAPLAGVMIVEPAIFGDDRGFFLESYSEVSFAAVGLPTKFVQDNHSRSAKGVLRGLHFQNPGAQGKLVRVVTGAVWDAVVDLRRSSPTFGQWFGLELSESNKRMLWIPEGFAHGFLTLEEGTDFLYKCTAPYAPQHEQSLAWDDPKIGIDWPVHRLGGVAPTVSSKDAAGLPLSALNTFE